MPSPKTNFSSVRLGWDAWTEEQRRAFAVHNTTVFVDPVNLSNAEAEYRKLAPVWVAIQALRCAAITTTPGSSLKSSVDAALTTLQPFTRERTLNQLDDAAGLMATLGLGSGNPASREFARKNLKNEYAKVADRVVKECKEQLK